LNLSKRKYAFEIRKRIFESALWTAGWNFKNQGDYFAKIAAEGVSFIWGRWISFGRSRLDRGEGERRPPAGAGVGRGGAMAGDDRSSRFARFGAVEREPKAPERIEARRELT